MTHPLTSCADRIPTDLRVSAARRLVTEPGPSRDRAARRLVNTAQEFGIDLNLLWGTMAQDAQGRDVVAQVCLGVPGTGRTVMLFLSGPGDPALFGSPAQQFAGRVESVRAALAGLAQDLPEPVLVQALPEPGETWAIDAYRAADMQWVGDLAYLRRDFAQAVPAASGGWSDGVEVAAVGDPEDFSPDGDGTALIAALDASYADTLDCPELCGLRTTRDVLASHLATGNFVPSRWWLVRKGGQPEGCCLLNHVPDHDSVELVYLGISPALRGTGLARTLLEFAIARCAELHAAEITCAVDRRNAPAQRLYGRMGFEEFTSRVAFVRPVGS